MRTAFQFKTPFFGVYGFACPRTAIVHVANSMVRALGFGFGGDDSVPSIDPAAWERLRLTPPLLDRALEHFDVDLDHALNYALFD